MDSCRVLALTTSTVVPERCLRRDSIVMNILFTRLLDLMFVATFRSDIVQKLYYLHFRFTLSSIASLRPIDACRM